MRSIVLTRPHPQNEGLAKKLQAKGANVVVCPMLEIVALLSPAELASAWHLWRAGDQARSALVVTSARTVELLRDATIDVDVPVFALGYATTDAAKAAGWDVKPGAAPNAEALLTIVAKSGFSRIWLPRSSAADSDLPHLLTEAGLSVTTVDAYRPQSTGAAIRKLVEEGIALTSVVFYSPSAVDAFVDATGAALAGVPVVAVGPTTASRVVERGLQLLGVAASPTDEAVLEVLCATVLPGSAIMGATSS